MAPRTRSATTSPVKANAGQPTSLEPKEPLKLFVLPRNTCKTARFLLLDHPRDEEKRRFFFCPQNGLYSFTKIGASSLDPRSILFATPECTSEDCTADASKDDQEDEDEPELAVEISISNGYVNKYAEFFVAAPFDLSFLLLPIVAGTNIPFGKTLFQPLDDILEDHLRSHKHLQYIFRQSRAMVEVAMERICDSLEAGDEKMYRFSGTKLLEDVLERAERAVQKGLPASLEEKFVTRTLERPVLNIKHEDISTVGVAENDGLTDGDSMSGNLGSQSTVVSSAASAVFSETSSTSTPSTATVSEDDVTPAVRHLQRLRTAIDFVTSSCVPSEIRSQLDKSLDSKESPLNLQPLTDHLKLVASLRAEALASRSVTDFSRKRGNIDDDEEVEIRAEKKRKIEEEEKRKKAGISRGVRELSKVNVSGMQKLSAFFTKQPASAKAKA